MPLKGRAGLLNNPGHVLARKRVPSEALSEMTCVEFGTPRAVGTPARAV